MMINFDSTKDELIEEIKNNIIPPQEWCNNPIWNKKYGYYWFGIGDGFAWHVDKLKSANKEDLLTIIAMCQSAWKEKYKNWDDKRGKELQKLYNFSRNCRKYIDLEDTSYESNLTMLDKALQFIKEHA